MKIGYKTDLGLDARSIAVPDQKTYDGKSEKSELTHYHYVVEGETLFFLFLRSTFPMYNLLNKTPFRHKCKQISSRNQNSEKLVSGVHPLFIPEPAIELYSHLLYSGMKVHRSIKKT